jgi:hypothetical protein
MRASSLAEGRPPDLAWTENPINSWYYESNAAPTRILYRFHTGFMASRGRSAESANRGQQESETGSDVPKPPNPTRRHTMKIKTNVKAGGLQGVNRCESVRS